MMSETITSDNAPLKIRQVDFTLLRNGSRTIVLCAREYEFPVKMQMSPFSLSLLSVRVIISNIKCQYKVPSHALIRIVPVSLGTRNNIILRLGDRREKICYIVYVQNIFILSSSSHRIISAFKLPSFKLKYINYIRYLKKGKYRLLIVVIVTLVHW